MKIVINIPKDKIKHLKINKLVKYPTKELQFVDLTDFAWVAKKERKHE